MHSYKPLSSFQLGGGSASTAGPIYGAKSNKSLTYSTSKPATFPWHCKHHVRSNISQQQHKMPTQEEGRIDLVHLAYISGQFKSLRCAAAAFNVRHQRLSNRLHGITNRRQTRPEIQS